MIKRFARWVLREELELYERATDALEKALRREVSRLYGTHCHHYELLAPNNSGKT